MASENPRRGGCLLKGGIGFYCLFVLYGVVETAKHVFRSGASFTERITDLGLGLLGLLGGTLIFVIFFAFFGGFGLFGRFIWRKMNEGRGATERTPEQRDADFWYGPGGPAAKADRGAAEKSQEKMRDLYPRE